MKKIGIVIPIYNTEKYLRQCVDSVLNQSYDNFSIALVDDGSTDGSGEICDEYAAIDHRIHVIHQVNKGKLAARYSGVCSLDCDYIAFVDSDDWIHADTYNLFSVFMENDVDIIAWKIVRYFSPEQQKVSVNHFPAGLYDEKRFREEVYPHMIWSVTSGSFGIDPSLCNKLVKKELILRSLEKAQGLHVDYGDDVAVIYPLFREVSTLFLSDAALYYHRQRDPMELAYYFSDETFYGKLYSLYAFLREQFSDELEFIDQLDMFYAKSVLYRLGERKKYLLDLKKQIFPFDKVPSGKNLILYGASIVGQSYYKQLSMLGYANKILWVDKNYHFYENLGVKSLDFLQEAKGYDYAVIAIANQKVAKEVEEWLSSHLAKTGVIIVWSIKEIEL